MLSLFFMEFYSYSTSKAYMVTYSSYTFLCNKIVAAPSQKIVHGGVSW
jgi:hypothetical protein